MKTVLFVSKELDFKWMCLRPEAIFNNGEQLISTGWDVLCYP